MPVFRKISILGAIAFVPAVLVFLAAGYESPRNILALTAGTVAYSLMTFNIVLATRLPKVEALLGGLDQVYQLHKWGGITILPLILIHTQLKFIQLEGIVPPGSLAETSVTFAKPAFFALVAVIVISAIKRVPRLRAELPWEWWRISHWLVAPIFLVLTFHQFFVKAPFDSTSAIRIWLAFAAIIGVFGLVWTAIAPWLRKRRYKVSAVNKLAGATHVIARPLRRPIRAREGQFAFVSAAKAGLRGPHPFTLSKLGADGTIEFCIQPAGDFTKRLRDVLQPGDTLQIEGGYGRFDFQRGGQRQIWLAGGIGITPFLAMAEAYARSSSDRQVVLIHAVRSSDLGIGTDRLHEIANMHSGFTFYLHDSATQGRLDAAKIAALLPFSPQEAELFFCGPKVLRHSIASQWAKTGKTPKTVHFEEFEFR